MHLSIWITYTNITYVALRSGEGFWLLMSGVVGYGRPPLLGICNLMRRLMGRVGILYYKRTRSLPSSALFQRLLPKEEKLGCMTLDLMMIMMMFSLSSPAHPVGVRYAATNINHWWANKTGSLMINLAARGKQVS